MPKVTNTRKQRAQELLARLQRGPSFDDDRSQGFDATEATRQFRMWGETWILEELKDLIPELRKGAK